MRLVVPMLLLGASLVGLVAGGAVSSWWAKEPESSVVRARRSAPSVVQDDKAPRSVVLSSKDFVSSKPVESEQALSIEEVVQDDGLQDPVSVEAALRAETDEHNRWFEAETSDPRWSSEAEGKLQASLDTVREARGGFNVSSVECKTSVCRADVEWHKSEEAPVLVDALAEADYGLECDVRVYSRKDDGAFSQGHVFYDCTDERAREYRQN